MRAFVAVVLMVCVPACREASPKGDAPAQGSAAVATAAKPAQPTTESKVDLAKKLALALTPGTTALDASLLQLQSAAKKMPEKSDAWITLGQAWVRKARQSADPGFYVNANACADVALDLQPDSKLALDLRGLVLLNDHKFEEARKLAKRVVDDHPDDPMGYGNLSDALLELGRFDEAASAVQKMVDLKPNLPSYSRASYVRWLQGDEAEALRFARLAIDAGTDTKDREPRAWMLTQSAIMFWHKGDFDGADAGFEVALKNVSEYPAALVGRARVALAKGDGKRAAELLERAYAQSPLVETAWLLGDAKQLAGDADGAAKAYAIVEKDGKANDPRTLSLYYSTKSQKPAEALALAEAEKAVRGDLYTDDALAWALYRNGNFADARKAIDRALAHGTKDARLLYHAGAIRIAAGETAPGKKLVADALKLNAKFDVTGAAEAERLLRAGDAGAK